MALALALLLAACAAGPRAEPAAKSALVENVPFYPQERFQCGPAALASVLNHYGAGLTPAEIAGDVYCDAALGSLTLDLELFARKKGFDARSYSGGLADLRARIDAGRPLVVMVDHRFLSVRLNHFMTVVGYEPDAVLVHSGRERLKRIKNDDFLDVWENTRFWTLLVTPKTP